MLRIVVGLLLLLSSGAPALAGAWPREQGELFISAGGNFWLSDGSQLPVYYDPTVYAEYGLTDRITLGLDMHTADKGRIGSAFVFAQVPIGRRDGPNKWALDLPGGKRHLGESALECAIRETEEECSLLLSRETLAGVETLHDGICNEFYMVDTSLIPSRKDETP